MVRFSYLLKPVSDIELKSIIDKAIETLNKKTKQQEFNSLMRIRGTQGAEFSPELVLKLKQDLLGCFRKM